LEFIESENLQYYLFAPYCVSQLIMSKSVIGNYMMEIYKEVWLPKPIRICVGLIMFYFIGFSNVAMSQSFSFGVIADCQYRAEAGSGIRKYPISDQKLKECVGYFNALDLNYVIHLGDFIDKDISSFDVVGPIYNQLVMSKYHVLGNHDFSVADELKDQVPHILGLTSRYYDFKMENWRFIVLDGNDISFHAYPNASSDYEYAEEYYVKNNIESPKWNGALSQKQMDWLKGTLEKASKLGEHVILYCHFPVFPENVHNLWNAAEVVELLEEYDCVKAFMNGHNHEGNYGIKKGIHYVTLHGMVDTDETSYAVIKIEDDKLVVNGFGREQNRELPLR